MSKYTTGELAKLCGVTVRTVQYYDSRGIMLPSALSEGGRRLYSEQDLQRMKIICFLRELDLPINSIARLLAEEHPEKVIDLLLQQRKHDLQEQIQQNQDKLNKLEHLQRGLKGIQPFSIESIGDIAVIMQNRKKHHKMRWTMIGIGLLMDALEVCTVLLCILWRTWWPILIGLPLVISLGVWISLFYFRNTVYICPECHQVFRPKLKDALWSYHTPNTRRLTCTACGYKGFCVETYGGK